MFVCFCYKNYYSDRKEGWAASASLPPERPFPASESPQGQERGSPTRSPLTSSTSTQDNQRRAERESRLVEATGTLQGPSAERGLLQGARGQASHTPACTQHPRFTKVAVRRKQRNILKNKDCRARGLSCCGSWALDLKLSSCDAWA